MIKGIYKSASGMIPRLKKQEITANNIANASTPGFKKDSVFLNELSRARSAKMPVRSEWQTPMIDQIYTDYSQGTFQKTGNPLDIAIEGGGFFVLQSPDGESTMFSRNGNLSIDMEGFLINSEGFRVLGEGGPINVGAGTVAVNESAEVQVDGNAVGSLQVVDFPDKSTLVKVGNTGFVVDETIEPVPATGFSVRQGFLERANMDVIREMVGMIISMRHFESGSKSMQIQDESLGTLYNQVGKTRI
jgi:flagellar basal-body rod protein FlgG